MRCRSEIALGAAATLVLIVAAVLSQMEFSATASSSAASTTREVASPAAPAFVPSMEGTRPDGAVAQADGALVVDAELAHLFDYYLAAQGEAELAAIKAGIERTLDQRLSAAAAAQAKRLLARYLDYKRALAGVEAGLPANADLAQAARARMAAVQRLRSRFFSSAESAGLFGTADARDADALARLQIAADSKLDPAQRAAQLAELDRRLPRALREEREAPLRIVNLEEQVKRLRAEGGTDDAVYRLRAAALSPEAAARLAVVDQEDAQWKARMAAYMAERAGLGATASEEAREQLRGRYFTALEQRRLGAYE